MWPFGATTSWVNQPPESTKAKKRAVPVVTSKIVPSSNDAAARMAPARFGAEESTGVTTGGTGTGGKPVTDADPVSFRMVEPEAAVTVTASVTVTLDPAAIVPRFQVATPPVTVPPPVIAAN